MKKNKNIFAASKHMRIAAAAAFFLSLSLSVREISATPLDGAWYISKPDRAPVELEGAIDGGGGTSADLQLPSYASIYIEKDRKSARPEKADFKHNRISAEVKFDGEVKDGPVKAVLFIKDKDGLWFQSQKIHYLNAGEWRTLSAELPASAGDLVPIGHKAAWSSLNAVTIHAAGVSLFSRGKGKIRISSRNIEMSGARRRPKLSIRNWQRPPENGELFNLTESRFELSREYFNPYDPDEIKIDVQALAPNGAESRWPAFFSQDYVRGIHFNREVLTPVGGPFWAFRFTPQMQGMHKLRIVIVDNSEETETVLKSPWVKINVAPSGKKGFVGVSKKDKRYFEFSNGDFFYPVGFNIHTPKDTRSEKRLGFGYIPDRGTYSYEDYFSDMAENGANAAEVWMASWSMALEWTSARINYYGLGRYNLANAWRLDHVLKNAAAKGIYIHLVLDNHGKLSSRVDQEWDDSPHNKNNAFAAADGAMLREPADFFTNKEAQKYYTRRNRYISGRWGGFTNILGIELWSEVDLVTEHRKYYENGISIEWHDKAARNLKNMSQGRHLVTTHTCSDYNKTYEHRKLFQLDSIDYVVSDAYRKDDPIIDLMRAHTETLRELGKPMLITEYGGTPQGNNFENLEADLHAGIWASFFLEHAGTPFLWWHDFIHRLDKYSHFKGFSAFIDGIDLRGKEFSRAEHTVFRPDGSPAKKYNSFSISSARETYFWIYDSACMVEYPPDMEDISPVKDHYLKLNDIAPGTYLAEFYNTITGEKTLNALVYSDGNAKIPLPPFKVDLAVKMFWQDSGPGGFGSVISGKNRDVSEIDDKNQPSTSDGRSEK